MRNLELLTYRHLDAGQDFQGSQCICIDYDSGNIYTASPNCIVGLCPQSEQVIGVVKLDQCDELPPDGVNRIVGMEFLADQQSVCVATDTGGVLLWNVSSGQVESVGDVSSGIRAMSWSPDQEMLILATGQDTLIMMTREFDPINEKSLHPDNFGAAQFVNVGWGKKETQFHGSIGKEAAKQKKEEVHAALPWDDKQPRISWRGDGQCFVVSSICPITSTRKLRVWSREFEHQSTSENVDGVEQALAWKPSGSLIASTQRRPNKHDVVFFEKNGLRHGEFSLPFGVKDVKVRELLWNTDSTVLAVWCEDLVQEGSEVTPKSYIQLWSVGNYHWYLKQSIKFDEDRVSSLTWDPEHAYRLHVLCHNGKYLQYTWHWATHMSNGALVAVIDGSKLLMTPTRQMVVPPPMSAYYLQLPTSVNFVSFCYHGNTDDTLLLLDDGRVAVYTFDNSETKDDSVKLDGAGGNSFKTCCSTPRLTGIYNITGLPPISRLSKLVLHVVWYNSDLVLFCCVDAQRSQHSTLYSCKFDGENLLVRSQVEVDGAVYNMCCDRESEDSVLAIQLTDGYILKYDIGTEMVIPWELSGGEELSFPIPCQQMALCTIGEQKVVLGLTNRYRFYVNNTEVASNCTSFAVHKEFLLLTTLTHTVRCICRKTKLEVLPSLSDGKAHPFDESIRRVERGSRIVAVVPDDTKLILQMPRGNLETIHPRALVLSAVRKNLDELKFLDAMTAMRRHRINVNLIYDHNPHNFLLNVRLFVQQINSVSHINLFLTDLQEEDVTRTMYTAAYNRSPLVEESEQPNKVDTVCDALRQSLIQEDEYKYILSILTSYAKKTTPELEEALLLVRSLRDNPSQNAVVSPAEALKYILFLVDVNEMFDVALGTYDFDLVLMVAEKSQKDPKEYIPFLNSLRRLEGSYQHYAIDKHLKRYSRALNNISKCPEHFDECLTLVSDHKLFKEALSLFKLGSQKYKEIAKLYGEHLIGKKRHEEAGLVYVKAEEWELALNAFMLSCNWRQVFCMTAKLKFNKENEVDLARKLANQLQSDKRCTEAAVVLEEYASDTEEAIVCLIEGSQWEEALRRMYKHNRTDFIETNLKPAMMESYEGQMESLETMRGDFDKYRKRLKVVREEKERSRLEFLESGGMNDADADLFSDTSSATGESIQSSKYSGSQSSTFTKSTGRSSRNRRKAEQKKWRLKEGSPYEDFALIAALSKIITAVDIMRDEVNGLVKVLVQFNFDHEASKLQQTFGSFLRVIDISIPSIWLDESEEGEESVVLGPHATANTIAQAIQRGQSLSTKEKLDPVIKNAPTLHKDIKWKLSLLEEDKL
ncbi:putative elongator complex protein 1 [Ostrea edulis]|uniref:putative elongator complex protein 1 n=1 Tax=Ostrea edulis TaxID=37623 RepID=UPI0024AE885D|nr:putative elongator complex protein 1 [Ostrea edulis]XP_056022734.1 putative elongator complex protein 1 [Ostrea edulis]XP_056022735.1 putative elongator complex protein 1 [Ostrea edulis]